MARLSLLFMKLSVIVLFTMITLTLVAGISSVLVGCDGKSNATVQPVQPVEKKILVSQCVVIERNWVSYNGMAGQIFALSPYSHGAVNNWYPADEKRIYFLETYYDVIEVTKKYIVLRVSADQKTE